MESTLSLRSFDWSQFFRYFKPFDPVELFLDDYFELKGLLYNFKEILNKYISISGEKENVGQQFWP